MRPKSHISTVLKIIFFPLRQHFIYSVLWFLKICIVIQLQLSAFSPHPFTPPQLNPPPFPASTFPIDFVHVSFIVVPVNPSPHGPLPTPLKIIFYIKYFSQFLFMSYSTMLKCYITHTHIPSKIDQFIN